MIINIHLSLNSVLPHLCHSFFVLKSRTPGRKRTSDSAVPCACGWMELKLSPSLASLSSLTSHYKFCYKVLTILVIGILACFCLWLTELWVNISSVKLTPKFTRYFTLFPFHEIPVIETPMYQCCHRHISSVIQNSQP